MEQSKDFPDAFHRVTVKGLCVRGDKLLMMRESETLSHGDWELPGGGLDFGEDIRKGFEREVKEEMGLQVTKMSKRPVYAWTHKYESRRDLDWYYALVLCYRVDFKTLDIIPSDECEEIKFFTQDELHDIKIIGQMTSLPGIFDVKDFTEPF